MSDNTPKVGAPTKYDPSLCDTVLEYMRQGDSKVAVAAKLDISRDTLYEWAKEHKEFSDTIKRGVDLAQAFWEDLGKELVLAGQGNATAWIYNMKCRFREDWADMTKTDVTSMGEKIGNNLTDDELNRLIESKVRQVGAIGSTTGEGKQD